MNKESSREPEATPHLLVGAERSGTTLLRIMLAEHPQLAWLNEFEYAVDFVPDEAEYPGVDEVASKLLMHRGFRATGFEID